MLRGDEAALVAAAVAGRSLQDVAAAAQVSVSTVQRRLRDPEILAAVRDGRSQQRREAVGQLSSQLEAAIDRLGQLLSDDDPNVALRAVGMALSNAHKYTIAIESDERLEMLEGYANGEAGHDKPRWAQSTYSWVKTRALQQS